MLYNFHHDISTKHVILAKDTKESIKKKVLSKIVRNSKNNILDEIIKNLLNRVICMKCLLILTRFTRTLNANIH
jgi:hypothetical protein